MQSWLLRDSTNIPNHPCCKLCTDSIHIDCCCRFAVNSSSLHKLHLVQAAHQGPAVLGLAMISMGEELGATMSLRMLEHLLRYGEPAVRCCPGCLRPGA